MKLACPVEGFGIYCVEPHVLLPGRWLSIYKVDSKVSAILEYFCCMAGNTAEA
jgi:hypothetical protein